MHGLPVLSITADSLDLFDYETGIFIPGVYYDPSDSTHTGNFQQSGSEWERQINVEFYEPEGYLGTSFTADAKLSGMDSRKEPQKSISVY